MKYKQTKPDICPACGADHNVLRESLEEKPDGMLETENHAIARIMIANCPGSKKEFDAMEVK